MCGGILARERSITISSFSLIYILSGTRRDLGTDATVWWVALPSKNMLSHQEWIRVAWPLGASNLSLNTAYMAGANWLPSPPAQ